LGDQQSLTLEDGDDTPGGALYVREILGLTFNESHVITNIFSLGINIFYDPNDPENAYLAGGRYLLPGSGYLEPAVPLPPTLFLLGSGLLGLGAVGWGRRRRQ